MHEISVIVASDADSSAICASFGCARRVRARGPWWIVPLSSGVAKQVLGAELSLPDLEDPAEAARLTGAIVPFTQALSLMPLQGAVALVFTQYSGGVGAQAAAVVREGALVFGPAVAIDAINTALAHLGVQPESGQDLFDSVGLGQWRSMDAFGGPDD
jgi:hypothetical protein